MKVSILAISLTLLSGLTFAQDGTEFKKFVAQTFEVHLKSLHTGNDVAPFLKSFSKDLNWVDVDVSIDGQTTTPVVMGKKDLTKKINTLAARPALGIEWDIQEYHELAARKETRMASFDVHVVLQANGSIISSGKNQVVVVGKKMEGFYVITYMSIVQLSDETYLGPCYTKITKKSDYKYEAETSYPDGTDYESIQNTFTIAPGDPSKLITIDGVEQSFYWNYVNSTVTLDRDARKIGNAANEKDAIVIVIQNLGAKKCAKVIRSNYQPAE